MNRDFTEGSYHLSPVSDICAHELFEAQVKLTPNTIAVDFEDRQLSYRELNDRSEQLAHYLQKNGVGPESMVGICVDRSLDIAVGILGILKAGGAFVPLDSKYPKERLSFMLQDANISILLTQSKLLAELPECRLKIVCLDSEEPAIFQENALCPKREVSAENLAYVIYTTGSTGKPKGVMVTHASLSNLIQTFRKPFGIKSNDICLYSASIAFVLSVRQLMVPLCQGAMVVIANNEQIMDPLALYALIKRKGVTMLDVVPSTWKTHIQALSGLKLEERKKLLESRLRQIVSVGEPLFSDIPQYWESLFQHRVRLINMYGQTETGGSITIYPIHGKDESKRKVVSIGRPIPNTKVHILDSNRRPVPAGIQGELYISGPRLARGYINRPDLTSEKFISDPFSEDPQARLYKTGDLGRYLPDGNIEVLGRVDRQVKISGIRIELEEIEVILKQHINIHEAVVTVYENKPDVKIMVAYLVPNPQASLLVSELRDFLKKKLQEYMIPSVFMMLDSIPLTPNGKIDRKALPTPDQKRPELEKAYAAPSTPTESKLAEIWCELLSSKRVGVHDNFFELGGHSLLATQLVTRLRNIFNVELPLQSIFETPTVRGLAKRIKKMQDENKKDEEGIGQLLDELEGLPDKEVK